MKNLFFLLASLGFFGLHAKDDPKYPVSAIPAELKENVDIVVRKNEVIFKILAKNRATYYVHEVFTIMNPNGDGNARETVPYNKLSKVSSFRGVVYDASGDVIKKLKSSDIYDGSAIDGSSLYSDERFKAANLSQSTYPYTVEFEYEVDYKYLYFIPPFIVSNEKISVVEQHFQLIYPKEIKPRFDAANIDVKPEVSMVDGFESTSWLFKNLKPMKFEPHSPASDLLPRIRVAPTQFEFDGYEGTMDSWVNFGNWIRTLNNGRGQLPDATKQKIRELTANLKTTEEKSKAVYEFMQNKTRYVSIQLGIGGLQPFEASVVDQTGYGDCKALSNYTVAMLAEAGVKAYYTLINSGRGAEQLNTGFPSSQFDHVVVFIPNDKDTVWLECTSQTSPFGYMGSFTGDRKALAITENGGVVVSTPVYRAEDNIQSRTAEVFLDITGDAKAKIRTTYSGIQYENDGLSFVVNNPHDDQKKWVEKNTGIPVYDINSFSMKNIKKKIPSAVVNLDLSLKRYASVNGKRVFLAPNLMNRSTFIPEKVENRKTRVETSMPYIDLDTVNFHLPDGIYPEFVPEPVVVKSRFGEYEARYIISDKGLTFIRRVRMNKGKFPPESYGEYIDFYRSINKADNMKLVFINKT